MRRRTMVLLALLFVGALALASLVWYNNREKRIPRTTITLINEAEGSWYLANVASYRMVVEVQFSDERRLHVVTVMENQVSEATLAYWDRGQRDWGAPLDTNADEGYWYTVPGLYETIRGALRNGFRDYVRADLSGSPPLPYTIVLGPTVVDGEMLDETVTWVVVREFTPLEDVP